MLAYWFTWILQINGFEDFFVEGVETIETVPWGGEAGKIQLLLQWNFCLDHSGDCF